MSGASGKERNRINHAFSLRTLARMLPNAAETEPKFREADVVTFFFCRDPTTTTNSAAPPFAYCHHLMTNDPFSSSSSSFFACCLACGESCTEMTLNYNFSPCTLSLQMRPDVSLHLERGKKTTISNVPKYGFGKQVEVLISKGISSLLFQRGRRKGGD